jgi:hypothetical protein
MSGPDSEVMLNMTRIIAQAYVDGSLVALPRCKTCGGSEGLLLKIDPTKTKATCPDCIDGWPRELVERIASSNLSLNEVLVVDVLAALREETQ